MSGTPEAKKAKNIDMAATLEERWAPLQTLMGRSTKFGMETGPLTFVDGMAFEPDPEVQDSIGEAKVTHSPLPHAFVLQPSDLAALVCFHVECLLMALLGSLRWRGWSGV